MKRNLHPLLPALALAAFSCSAQAQTVLTGDHVIQGNLCVGGSCSATETFDQTVTLKLRRSLLDVDFVDTSGDTFPDRDWRLVVNDGGSISSGGIERFSVRDLTEGTTPFTLEGGAPDNAFWMTPDGDIGLGTMLPQADLHISRVNENPRIMMERTGPGADTWYLESFGGGFGIHNGAVVVPNMMPFRINNNNSSNYMMVLSNNNIGFGTPGPDAPVHINVNDAVQGGKALLVEDIGSPTMIAKAMVHVLSDAGHANLMVEETAATTTPRTLLNLQNNGRPEIVMGNAGTGGEWSFGAGTNFVLKQGAVGTASSAKTKLFEVKASGDAVLTGTLTTGGTTCGTGCDRVFDEDFDLPSIADHADAMFTLGHLPNMGPMVEGAPFNLTDKFGRLLNEVEHAHIYIAQQEARIAELERMVSALAQDRVTPE